MKLAIFGTKYQMIQQRYKEHTYKADRRPYVQMMVEKYESTRKDHKYFLIGLSIGLMPYIVHMNQWL
jgi:hypothetical protein